MTYPHPSFDLSSAFIPPSMKELYRWCLYLYMTHSEIKPILKKKVAYVQTPLIYKGTENSKKVWKSLLEDNIHIKRISIEALLDMSVYGVAYMSIAYPFERFLICPACKEKYPIKNLKWTYEGHKWMSDCPECHHRGEFTSKCVTVRNRKRIKIIRWRPMDMEVQSNPWTGYKRYIYRVPRYLVKKIEDPKRNRVLVETTPDELLESIKQNKNFGLDEDQVYVFEELGPSSEDENFPIPPLLHVFKDSWLYQTLRRAQEAISVEHILPLTVLIPAAAPAGASPHLNYNLQTWAANMQDMVRTWRRDPNAIFTAPFPATVENIRGDAKALNVFNDMEMVRQQIAGGLDVPVEFVIGNLQWSGASVSLRVLENLFLNMIEDLTRFEQTFLIPRLQRFLRLPKIQITHQDFKMADDAQQKQIALGLRQTNTISDRSTVEQLDFDYDKEKEYKRAEREQRLRDMYEEQIESAKTQAEQLLITGRAQMQLQAEQNDLALKAQQAQSEAAMQAGQPMVATPAQPNAAAPSATFPGPPPGNNGTSGGPPLPSPSILGLMAEHFMKNTPDNMKDQELIALQETNAPLARAIQQRMKVIQNASKAVTALPEQKPPRNPARAGI
jgi:hypothetical protein